MSIHKYKFCLSVTIIATIAILLLRRLLIIVRLILQLHQNATAEKTEDFRGFLLNISKTGQLIFTKLMSVLGNPLFYF